jgi:hypothetical protein
MSTVKRKCKVIMLPTEKATNALKGYLDGSFLFNYQKEYTTIDAEKGFTGYYHLYILSDDKPKVDDWCINLNSPHKHKELCRIDNQIELEQHVNRTGNNCKKIIATTDQTLEMKRDIIGGFETGIAFSQPSDSFVKKFIEVYNSNNPITEVMVEYVDNGEEDWFGDDYTGEPFWNEKLELKVNPKDNTLAITKIKDSWSKEEVSQLLANFLTHCWNVNYQFNGLAHDEVAKKWIEENL